MLSLPVDQSRLEAQEAHADQVNKVLYHTEAKKMQKLL
jgi:hypothetical protein